MASVSVVVPIYKVEEYIHRCINSILGQTYADFELILVDDGSPDSCGMICDEYALLDKRVHVIHKKNGGLSSARNSGIESAFTDSDSDWITFVDSDDWVHPKYLESMINAAKENSVELVVCGFCQTSGDEPIVTQDLCGTMIGTEEFYVTQNINATITWGKLYKKEMFYDVRFPEGRINEDEYVTYKLLFRYSQICVIKQPLYAYFQNPESIMRSRWSPKRMDSMPAIENQVEFFTENGYLNAAKLRYVCLINQLIGNRSCIKSYQGFSEEERQGLIKKIDCKTREMVLKYRDYKWLSLNNGGLYFQAYATVFPPFKLVYYFGFKIKCLLGLNN